jgi:hypothetical protein
MKTNALTLLVCFFLCVKSSAQQFADGWCFPFELSQGIHTPTGYVGSAQFTPSVTIVKKYVRLGASVGTLFNGHQFDFIGGPKIIIKLKEVLPLISKSPNASVYCFVEHLWGTNNYKLIGGGLGLDVFENFVFSVKAHYDYEYKSVLIQTGIGINLFRKKESNDTM